MFHLLVSINFTLYGIKRQHILIRPLGKTVTYPAVIQCKMYQN